MTPADILASATVLLASSRNSSYTAKQAVRDARELAREVEEATREPDLALARFGGAASADQRGPGPEEVDDCA